MAVCEKYDGTIININQKDIPSYAKEGDVLSIEDGKITIDVEETKSKKE